MGLVQCGATGPSVFIDSDTEMVILFPDQLQRGRKPFLVSLLYSAIISIICSALGSLPSLVCRPVEIILAPQHIVKDYCTLSRGYYKRSQAELTAHAT